MDFLSQRMDKKLSVFCVILDRSHVLIPLNIEKDLSDVYDGDTIPNQHTFFSWQWLNTMTASSKLMGSHSKTVGSSWNSEVGQSAS